MKVSDRLKSPTPKFFQKIRNIGLFALGTSAVIATSPVAMPAILLKIAGYLAVGGTIASGVGQLTVEGEEK